MKQVTTAMDCSLSGHLNHPSTDVEGGARR